MYINHIWFSHFRYLKLSSQSPYHLHHSSLITTTPLSSFPQSTTSPPSQKKHPLHHPIHHKQCRYPKTPESPTSSLATGAFPNSLPLYTTIFPLPLYRSSDPNSLIDTFVSSMFRVYAANHTPQPLIDGPGGLRENPAPHPMVVIGMFMYNLSDRSSVGARQDFEHKC